MGARASGSKMALFTANIPQMERKTSSIIWDFPDLRSQMRVFLKQNMTHFIAKGAVGFKLFFTEELICC